MCIQGTVLGKKGRLACREASSYGGENIIAPVLIDPGAWRRDVWGSGVTVPSICNPKMRGQLHAATERACGQQ